MEYALSYWLQKTTEHSLGCVLCAPGCFSLYRASALMDDNVMRMFAQKPECPDDHMLQDLGKISLFFLIHLISEKATHRIAHVINDPSL